MNEAMVMPEACIAMGDIHDRMPVILKLGEYSRSPGVVLALWQPYEAKLAIERTVQPLVARR